MDFSSIKNSILGTSDTPNSPQSQGSIDRLRHRIQHYALRDEKAELLGEVRDVIENSPSDETFNLVISHPDFHRGFRLFLLNSQYISKIDDAVRSVFTTLGEREINQFPEYQATARTSHYVSDASFTSGVSAANTPPVAPQSAPPVPTRIADEKTIRLLEEKLSVDRTKRKVGEVIVRKEIETRMIEVPVRREKLIVEQVGDSQKRLAEIDLGTDSIAETGQAGNVAGRPIAQGQFQSIASALRLLDAIANVTPHQCQRIQVDLKIDHTGQENTHHEFTSPQLAIAVLDAIAKVLPYACREVRVELLLESDTLRQTYQNWCDRFSQA